MKFNLSTFKPCFMRYAHGIQSYLIFLKRRVQSDMIFRVAASLSYTSLIAIVPLVAIGLAIFAAFPVFNDVKEQIQQLLIRNVVPDLEQEISLYFNDFVNATAQLTTIGVVGIAVTAILMLSTIENSLNFIFKVYKPRNIKTKITLYWTVITLGPLLLGAAFSLRGYLYSLQQYVPDNQIFLSNIIPHLITMLVLFMVYVLVPNKKVKISNALIGAVVAVVLFWLLRRFFGMVILSNATYKTLYGALAILPIFLIWMFSVWSVVIFGAVITASLEEFDQENKDEQPIQIIEKNNNFQKKHHRRKKFLQKEQK